MNSRFAPWIDTLCHELHQKCIVDYIWACAVISRYRSVNWRRRLHELPTAWIDTLCHCGWNYLGRFTNRPLTLWQERGYLYEHSPFSGTMREPQGGEKASAKHQTKVRQSLGDPVFSHQVTSGIMRERHLMCACRVCPLPAGLGESQWGEHLEERGNPKLICSHSLWASVIEKAPMLGCFYLCQLLNEQPQ